MTEDFLHYIWKFQRFKTVSLKTTDGLSVQVIKPGEHNTNAGPDFFNAKIKIGGTVWAGNVEIHVNSSDWLTHYHSKDKAYDNVILHVVFNNDEETINVKGEKIPTLEIANQIPDQILERHNLLVISKSKIPCELSLPEVDPFVIKNWQERLIIERLEKKSLIVEDTLRETQNDWEETLYRSLCANFGFKVNTLPFEMLSRSLPLKYIQKHSDNQQHIEAMLLGQAGFLEGDFQDNYARQMQKEFEFFKNKFQLKPIDRSLWKLLRLRPANFPVVRIVQLAELLTRNKGLFSRVMEAKQIEDLQRIFSVNPKGYWEDHYLLDKSSTKRSKKLGKSSVDIILINTIVPVIFWYGKTKNNPSYQERAIEFLQQISTEKNAIIDQWNDRGVATKSAFESQSLLQLYNEYCTSKRCLNCAIGNKILSS